MSTDKLTIRTVPISQLTEDRRNARNHDKRNLDAIRNSLRRFGQVEPLVVRKKSRTVIGGNGRLAVMRDMGIERAKIVELDISAKEAKALGIALNRTAELADWNLEQLSELVGSMGPSDLVDVGFEPKEIEELLGELDPDREPFDEEQQQKRANTKELRSMIADLRESLELKLTDCMEHEPGECQACDVARDLLESTG